MTQAKEMIEELDNCFLRTAVNIMKYYDDKEESQKMLKELKDVLKENCRQFARIKTADGIRDQLECTFALEPQRSVEDFTKEYRKAIAEIQVNPLEDGRMLHYDRQIEDLLQANRVAVNNGQDNVDDADLQLICREINVIDPISKTRMTDPVKNMVCGHVYDRESLVAMLQKNKNTRCPVVGCTSMNYIDLKQCRPDLVTKTYLENNPA